MNNTTEWNLTDASPSTVAIKLRTIIDELLEGSDAVSQEDTVTIKTARWANILIDLYRIQTILAAYGTYTHE